MSTPAPTLTLPNGVQMPRLGLGTWPMDDAQATTAIAQAIDLGYRLIDTAENYENERGVGAGIKASGIDRSEIFLTTKFNRKWHSIDGVRQALEASLDRLGLDYVDLFLVHWPNPDQGRHVEAVEGLLKVMDDGLIRSFGTSNYKPAHLAALFERGIVPHVNQIQLDPYHPRRDLIALHREKGIVTEAWSPLDRPTGSPTDLVNDPAVLTLADKYGRSGSQIVLRWHVQNDFVPSPKSSDPTRQAENLAVFDFELTPEEMVSLEFDKPAGDEFLDADTFGH